MDIMDRKEAKRIIRRLGLSGYRFSEILGKNKNYVTDFKRAGVPQNITIILTLCEKLLEKNVPVEEILSVLKKNQESFSE